MQDRTHLRSEIAHLKRRVRSYDSDSKECVDGVGYHVAALPPNISPPTPTWIIVQVSFPCLAVVSTAKARIPYLWDPTTNGRDS